MLTPERITELASMAFKLSGYQTKKEPDGSTSISCNYRTMQLMHTFQELLVGEIDPTEKTS